MTLIERIQEALRRKQLDGWLFFDHHRRDPLAYRILQIPQNVQPTRRWYYFVPAAGEPRKLVHQIESGALDHLPGRKEQYSRWAEQQQKLVQLLAGATRVAMQYSPNCAIPYISLIDAGTMELVRSTKADVVSSADLVQEFEARWTEDQARQHFEAGKLVDQVRRDAFDFLRARLRSNNAIDEYQIQQFILSGFSKAGLITDHGPIVAVNANASDPHYEPSAESTLAIHKGDLVLIDLWAKLADPTAVYYDVTWTGFCDDVIPAEIQNVFEIVRDARKRASSFVVDSIKAGREIAGYQVDDQARGFIEQKGFEKHFFHRTGHNIGTEVHGTGANMDNLESHDDRLIIPETCFSIEPGIYLPHFGIRSEVNIYVGNGFAQVTGEEQQELIRV